MKQGQLTAVPIFIILINKTIKLYTIIFFSCSALYSQNINLTGKITDSQSGDPLIGANVIIDGNGLNTGAATDFNGDYIVEGVPSGSYKIKVSYIGYSDFTTELNISSESSTFDAKLSISAILLDEYIVTASRGRREKSLMHLQLFL